MVGAGLQKFDECKGMSIEVMDFIIHHHKQFEDTKILSLAKLLGTSFPAGEIRSWFKNQNKGAPKVYKDSENVLMPLSLVLKPELREHLKKVVGDALQMSEGYTPGQNEQIISLGQVTPEEFQYFLRHKQLPEETLQRFRTNEG